MILRRHRAHYDITAMLKCMSGVVSFSGIRFRHSVWRSDWHTKSFSKCYHATSVKSEKWKWKKKPCKHWPNSSWLLITMNQAPCLYPFSHGAPQEAYDHTVVWAVKLDVLAPMARNTSNLNFVVFSRIRKKIAISNKFSSPTVLKVVISGASDDIFVKWYFRFSVYVYRTVMMQQ